VRKLNSIVAKRKFQHRFTGNECVKSFQSKFFGKKNFPTPGKRLKIVKCEFSATIMKEYFKIITTEKSLCYVI
jgi:hypothetical protein